MPLLHFSSFANHNLNRWELNGQDSSGYAVNDNVYVNKDVSNAYEIGTKQSGEALLTAK